MNGKNNKLKKMKPSKINKTKRPKIIWAFWANIYGPWYKTPQRAHLQDYSLEDQDWSWWNKDGNSEITKLGFYKSESGGYITFAHEDKAEVEKFMLGYHACRDIYREIFNPQK